MRLLRRDTYQRVRYTLLPAKPKSENGFMFPPKRVITTGGIALVLLIVLLSVYLPGSHTSHGPISNPIPPSVLQDRRDQVAEAFQHAWNGYTKHCFGRDTLHPVSNTCEDDFGGWGATAIDSLSTAILLENEAAVIDILKFISTVDFRKVKSGTKIQTFEVTIRHFAAMISAWDLLHSPFAHLAQDPFLRETLHEQMISLGDGLSCAFDTPSGIPRDWVDPLRCSTDHSAASNAITGAGTLILEFARLADITGNQTYAHLAEKSESYLLDPQPEDHQPYPGLLGSYVSVMDGSLMDTRGSWGAFADSFYEYLIKGYLYNSDKYQKYLERWLLAVDSTMQYIGSHPHGRPDLTLLSTWSGQSLSNSMESLSWFAGGNIILGGMVTNNQSIVDYGLSIADAAGQAYNITATGLGGEFVTWSTSCDQEPCDPKDAIRVTDSRFRLRPEVLETWYYAYRATGNVKYMDWSWAAFEKINKYCRTDTGFGALKDVNAEDGGGPSDVQESFVFAEIMKYVWLTHVDDAKATYQVQDSRTKVKNTWVLNTEAHPLRVQGTPR